MEDNQVSPNVSIYRAENIESFQDRVNNIFHEIEKDEKFQDLSPEIYDQKKSFLTENLKELSRMHKLLTDQHVDLIKEVTTKNQQLNLPTCHSFYVFDPYHAAVIYGLQWQLSSCESALSERENTIGELNKKINIYIGDIRTLTVREKDWTTDFNRLRTELQKKMNSVKDLSKRLEALTLEKDRRNAEWETRFNSLKNDHERVLSSFTNEEEAKNEVTKRVVELEREVVKQKEVITVRDEEKREAIRQLSGSVEHYKSRYEEIREAYAAVNKVSAACFDFLK